MQTIFLYFPVFFAKIWKICITGMGKTSTSNNFGYVKGSALMFAANIRFSAMADRMTRPPSLSHDRNYPRLPNRHKFTLKISANQVVYEQEQRRNDSNDVSNAFCIALHCSALQTIKLYIFQYFWQKYTKFALQE